uniref:HMG box domain-containing protein n=1 Tax=Trichuris muris TaxID=70415 RepID=A0A5S6QTM8_TRIMR
MPTVLKSFSFRPLTCFAPSLVSVSGRKFGKSCAYAVFAKEFADNPENFNEEDAEEQRRRIDAKRKVTILMNRYGYPPLPSPNAYQMYTKECFEKSGKGKSVASVMADFANGWKALSAGDRQKLEQKVTAELAQFSQAVLDWEAKMKEQKLGAVLKAINLGLRTIESKQGPRRLLQKQLAILKKQHNFPEVKQVKPYSLFVHEKLRKSSGDQLKQTDRLKRASEAWNSLAPSEKLLFAQRAESVNQSSKDKLSSWREGMEGKGLSDVVERIDWMQAKVRNLSRKSKATNVEQLLEKITMLKTGSISNSARKKKTNVMKSVRTSETHHYEEGIQNKQCAPLAGQEILSTAALQSTRLSIA